MERIEIITGRKRRRQYTAEEKVRLVEQTMRAVVTVATAARLHGVAPSLLFQRRRRMAKGGNKLVRPDEDVVPVSRAGELNSGIRELERLLGQKTLETAILRDSLEQACPRDTRCACSYRRRAFPGEGHGRHTRRRRVQLGPATRAARASVPWRTVRQHAASRTWPQSSDALPPEAYAPVMDRVLQRIVGEPAELDRLKG
jgi:transposase